jgi:hypothetical protein
MLNSAHPPVESSAPRARLDYVPVTPTPFRSGLVRYSMAGLMASAALLSAITWGPQSLRRVGLYLLQRQCAAYVAPPNLPAIGAVPDCWSRFYARLSPPGGKPDGMIFLHERVSPSGNRRLVALELHLGSGNHEGPEAHARVIALGTPARPPREIFQLGGELRFQSGASVSAATADESDSSHFVFVITGANGNQTIDGWLTDDDRVILEPRRN